VNIDGTYNDVKWLGGSDPSTGGASGNDSYVVSVIPNVTVASGVGVTVGLGKTMIIDVLQIGGL